MKAIILAGGRATRLPEAAKDKPKVLVEVGGKPVLAHQIALLEKHGITDIRLALGYKSEQIIDYCKANRSHTEFVVEQEPLGTGGSIKLASSDIKEPFLVLNGDELSNLDISVYKDVFANNTHPNMIAVTHIEDARSFGLVKHEAGKVTAFLEKPEEKQVGDINIGMYILDPHEIQKMPEGNFSIERDFFPRLVQEGKLGVFVHEGWRMEMGTEERLTEVKRYFEGKL